LRTDLSTSLFPPTQHFARAVLNTQYTYAYGHFRYLCQSQGPYTLYSVFPRGRSTAPDCQFYGETGETGEADGPAARHISTVRCYTVVNLSYRGLVLACGWYLSSWRIGVQTAADPPATLKNGPRWLVKMELVSGRYPDCDCRTSGRSQKPRFPLLQLFS
jgi:hypothetical protein